MNVSQKQLIPAGVRVHLIKSPRGSYIRTPDGKFFAIRQPASTTINNPKPMPMMPEPPPPLLPLPPPPPLLPLPPPPSSSLIDELLYGMRNKFKKSYLLNLNVFVFF